MKLSLTEMKKLYAASGRRPLAIKVNGHVDAIVRNEDGSVDQAISKSNLATDLWNERFMWPSVDLRNMYVFILPDDNGNPEPFRTAARHVYSNAYDAYVTASVNTSTSTWTWTAVLGTPSVNRVFRYIGLRTGDQGQHGDASMRAASYIYNLTKMTSDISQTTSQTLEVVYRVSFTRA